MKIEIREYLDARGHNHYREWLSGLDPSVKARVIKFVLRMGDGNFSAAKPEGEGISELQLDFGPGYRVYFGQDGDQLVILLAGGVKRRQQEDIQEARTLWVEYKKRKREQQKEK